MASSRILELANVINKGTAEIHSYFEANKLPFPSFNPTASATLPQELSKFQDSVLDATNELQELLISPATAFTNYGHAQNQATLVALERLDIANCFPPEETSTFARIAEQTGINERYIKALLRNAMTMRIFCEPAKDVVAHTCRSALLRQREYKSLVSAGIEDMGPAALKTAQAVEKWPLLEEPTQTGFCIAHQTDQPMYKFIQERPERAQRFADSMSILSGGTGLGLHHVVDGFPWDTDKPTTVVDIGGSQGHVSIALAKAYPSLNFVVQDLSDTVDKVKGSLPEDMPTRIKFMAHDFFQPQPVVADIYFLRWIFHNWPEKYCIDILRALVPALRPGARVYVCDTCMPEPGAIPIWNERNLRRSALNMISFFNGLERDTDEWKQLFEKADSKFQLREIRQPPGSNLAMIEVVWQG